MAEHRTPDRPHPLLERLARSLHMRASDLRDRIRLAVIVVVGFGFVIWWQATHAL